MDENVKQKFTKLIEYQKKDIELRKLNAVLERDDALVSMNKNKRAFNEAKQTLVDCDQQASGLLEMYGELQKYIDDNEALLAELENGVGDSEEELEARVKRLESLKSKFQSADKKMHDVDEKSKSVCKRRADALKSGKAAQQQHAAARENKPELLEKIRSIGKDVEIRFGMQENPRGSGDAVMRARDFTGAEPFVMCNGDDLIVADIPASKQLIDAYKKDPALVLGVQKVARGETDKYGIINPIAISGRFVRCDDIIEKPKNNPPSLYAALGRYVLTPEIYEYIKKLPQTNGEVSLTDAICAMIKNGRGYAYEFDGTRYDMGDKFGALTATVDFALKRMEFKDKFKDYLKSVLRNEN